MGSPTGRDTAQSTRTWLALGYFAVATLLLVHPLYSQLGNFVEPRVLGMPFSLVYVLIIIAANTLVLTWLYRARWIDAGDESPEGTHSRELEERAQSAGEAPIG